MRNPKLPKAFCQANPIAGFAVSFKYSRLDETSPGFFRRIVLATDFLRDDLIPRYKLFDALTHLNILSVHKGMLSSFKSRLSPSKSLGVGFDKISLAINYNDFEFTIHKQTNRANGKAKT